MLYIERRYSIVLVVELWDKNDRDKTIKTIEVCKMSNGQHWNKDKLSSFKVKLEKHRFLSFIWEIFRLDFKKVDFI